MDTHLYDHLQGAPISPPDLLNNSRTHSRQLHFLGTPLTLRAHAEKLYAILLQINLNVEDELDKSAQLKEPTK
jgi:hypothetical protein